MSTEGKTVIELRDPPTKGEVRPPIQGRREEYPICPVPTVGGVELPEELKTYYIMKPMTPADAQKMRRINQHAREIAEDWLEKKTGTDRDTYLKSLVGLNEKLKKKNVANKRKLEKTYRKRMELWNKAWTVGQMHRDLTAVYQILVRNISEVKNLTIPTDDPLNPEFYTGSFAEKIGIIDPTILNYLDRELQKLSGLDSEDISGL